VARDVGQAFSRPHFIAHIHEFLTVEHCRGTTAFILADEASCWERGGLEVVCQCMRRIQRRALDEEKEGYAFKIGRFGPR
jgi:hypothetical protein